MVDAPEFARQIVAVLVPLFPLLRGMEIAAGDKISKSLGESLGNTALAAAGKVWHQLWPSLGQKPEAAETLRELAVSPSDLELQSALAVQIRRLLDKDAALRASLESVVSAASVNINANSRSGLAVAGMHLSGNRFLQRHGAKDSRKREGK